MGDISYPAASQDQDLLKGRLVGATCDNARYKER